MDKRNRGTFYEEAAAEYIKNHGIEILEHNFRCRLGEIDIIGLDKDTIVFFEVKYRKSDSFGSPFDAIDVKKQRRIINAAKYYLTYKATADKYVRFDAIGITGNEIEWIKDAFCL